MSLFVRYNLRSVALVAFGVLTAMLFVAPFAAVHAAGALIAINAGGPAVAPFGADSNATGGNTAYANNSIDTSAVPQVPAEVFRSERWGEFTYSFANIPAGIYRINIYLCEFYFNGPKQRLFNILVNANLVAVDVDIIALTGAKNRAMVLSYGTSPSAAGQIVIDFKRGSADYPKVSAVEIQVIEQNVPGPATTPFLSNSFWYTPLPSAVPLHPNSANFVTDFIRQRNSYYGTVGINTLKFSSPIYYADASTPVVNVTQWDCMNIGYLDPALAQQWTGVPIPSYAQTADPQEGNGVSTDAEMTIVANNTLIEFWKARKVNGQWQACWGGRMDNMASNPGIWPNPYGVAATGLPFLGGQVTAEELQAGVINHVIGIALVDVEAYAIFSWPANRSDGYNPNGAPNRIPEGLRGRLDPSVNVDALSIHPVAKTVAKALQKYGFVIWDKGGAISLRFRNPKSYTLIGKPDPYPALFNGTPDYAILNGIPWDKLQFLPMNYGKP